MLRVYGGVTRSRSNELQDLCIHNRHRGRWRSWLGVCGRVDEIENTMAQLCEAWEWILKWIGAIECRAHRSRQAGELLTAANAKLFPHTDNYTFGEFSKFASTLFGEIIQFL
jgi:hypothetical protein